MASSPDLLCINTLRCLSIDAVQKADSGHPGLPLGVAPMAYVLWTRHLRHNPKNPNWWNRDRFVLSAGHGSALLYSLLHLTGYDLPMDQLKRFRQWGSQTPGHPEYGDTPGVEVTTGPLGQGIGSAVGMAIAQKHLATVFNRPGLTMCDYRIYVIASDGDLMEGVASEAASLAGHLGLDNLIVLYDDNHISIDGATEITFTENRARRFEAYGWHTQTLTDGNDIGAIDRAIALAKKTRGKPHLIKIRTHIGYGSPNKVDSPSAHGSPLGDDEVALTKQALGWDPKKKFFIPPKAQAHFKKAITNGKKLEADWLKNFSGLEKKYPDIWQAGALYHAKQLPKNWASILPEFKAGEKVATRKASHKVINALAPHLPFLIGGSADLAASNLTTIKDSAFMAPGNFKGRNIHFGVREHAMAAACNGIALTRNLVPFCATFLIFTDYCRPAIRLAALMGLQVIYVMTHDSISLGEDGPTHQPVEHLSSLRAIPNLTVIRPADANETAQAWRAALENKTGPTLLALTRQGVPTLDRSVFPPAARLRKGAYVLADFVATETAPINLLMIATGSEVSPALQTAHTLAHKDGLGIRVVSMPSWELFQKQSRKYRDSVLPSDVTKRVAIEAASPLGWHRWIGRDGLMISMERFGASAPGDVNLEQFGFTAEKIAARVRKWLKD